MTWILAVLVALAVLYAAGWFAAAQILAAQAREHVGHKGGLMSCADASVGGFPFSFALSCSATSYEFKRTELKVAAGALKARAGLLSPTKVAASLDGPALVETSLAQVRATWQLLTGDVDYARPVPNGVKLDWQGLALSDANGGAGAPAAEIGSGTVTAAPEGRDFVIHTSFADLSLSEALTGIANLPLLSGEAEFSLTDGVAVIASRTATYRGTAGVIRDLTLSVGGDAGVSISGPISINPDGLVDATLSVIVRDPKELARLLGEAFPDYGNQIQTVIGGLTALGATPSIPLRIDAGSVWLGFIPVGVIPPL